jgi:hypothetical protein
VFLRPRLATLGIEFPVGRSDADVG